MKKHKILKITGLVLRVGSAVYDTDHDEMRHLIELGCDCIMTDDPILLKSVLAEYAK